MVQTHNPLLRVPYSNNNAKQTFVLIKKCKGYFPISASHKAPIKFIIGFTYISFFGYCDHAKIQGNHCNRIQVGAICNHFRNDCTSIWLECWSHTQRAVSLSLSLSLSIPLLICGVNNFYVCGRFSTPSFYHFFF